LNRNLLYRKTKFFQIELPVGWEDLGCVRNGKTHNICGDLLRVGKYYGNDEVPFQFCQRCKTIVTPYYNNFLNNYKLKAIRGATTVKENTKEEISKETINLIQQIMLQNSLNPYDIVSIIFSMTQDLNACFPAEAVRKKLGMNVPLFCCTEIDVPGSLKKCIRVLVHSNVLLYHVSHVYLNDAINLKK